MKKNAESIGGTNFLLSLMETMKEKQTNALMDKKCLIKSAQATIKWNKIVFKDKLDTLESVIHNYKTSEENNFNILDVENEKMKKKILNMVKTLAPIEFSVAPIDSKNGTGFSFKIFDNVDNNSAKLNPVFIAMFFCSTNFMKKVLKA
jgi:hypothetical protein